MGAWPTPGTHILSQASCFQQARSCRATGEEFGRAGLRPWGPGMPRWGIRCDPAGNREPLELQQHEPINKLSDSPGSHRLRAPPHQPFTCRDPSCIVLPARETCGSTHVQRSTRATRGPSFSRDPAAIEERLSGPGGGTACAPRWGGRLDLQVYWGSGRSVWGSQAGLVNSHWKKELLVSPTGPDPSGCKTRRAVVSHACSARFLGLQLLPGRVLAAGLRISPTSPGRLMSRTDLRQQLSSSPDPRALQSAGELGEAGKRRQGPCAVSEGGGHSGGVGSDSTPASGHPDSPVHAQFPSRLCRPRRLCEPPDVRPTGSFSA